MEKNVFEYQEKHHILTVDGNDYEIPQRTAELEEKIKEHDNNLDNMSEYEANIQLLEILFGKTKAKKMFPEGKKTNLDKLSQCTAYAISLFMAEFNRVRNEKVEAVMTDVAPLLQQMTDATNTVKNIKSKQGFKKFASKKV